jgi:nucleotide-binding universal stress UspA family protein
VTSLHTVLCALDLSAQSRAVLYHAAGIAGAAGARLRLVTATGGSDISELERELQALFFDTVPYGATYLGEPYVEARAGSSVEVILSSAREHRADLIVAGSRGRGALARLLLGSTSAKLLQETDRPVLFVPPGDIEVVSLGSDRVGLQFGTVLVAVDLSERNDPQLALGAALAGLARQPLMLLNVADAGADEHDVAQGLRARAHETGVRATAFIVRKGDVPAEIARAARHERAGLVVMGLRDAGRGTPGAVANAVLESGRTLVLAVPAA